jgi:hypothetical protein
MELRLKKQDNLLLAVINTRGCIKHSLNYGAGVRFDLRSFYILQNSDLLVAKLLTTVNEEYCSCSK